MRMIGPNKFVRGRGYVNYLFGHDCEAFPDIQIIVVKRTNPRKKKIFREKELRGTEGL